MSALLAGGTPVALFGDVEKSVWGVAIGGPEPQLAVGTLAETGVVSFEPASAERSPEDREWRLSSSAGTVRIRAGVPEGLIEIAAGDGAPPAGEVAGTLQVDDREHQLEAAAVSWAELPGGRLGSIRLVGAWFPARYGLALVAGRPPGAAGHDRDQIGATIVGEERRQQIFEPRLTTTYDGGGAVSRMGIELWMGETEDGEQTPRRVAGERAGSAAQATITGTRAQALGLRCHSRGEDGVGVYLLLRPA